MAMGKKKILFVINTLSAAGAEMSFLELLRRLDPLLCDIDVYVLTAQGELKKDLPDYVNLLNGDFCEISVLEPGGRRHLIRAVAHATMHRLTALRLLPYLLRTFLSMIKKRRIQPDKLLWQVLAQGSDSPPGEYDLAAAYLEGGSAYYVADRVKAAKKVAYVHIDYARAGYTRDIDRSCYLAYDHVFAVSDEAERSFLDAYPELAGRVSLFHNPLDRARIRHLAGEPIRDARWNGHGGARLLSVGRLDPQKSYGNAIEAMRLVKSRRRDIRWYVLGEGGERGRLEQLIRRAGLEEDFLLMGQVANPYPYFAGCDLYVQLSSYEGRSVAIQEAMALGRPVLASDCSGNREQIRDGYDGVLTNPDPGAAADEILRMLDDVELLDALGARAAEKEDVHPEEITELLSYAGIA